MNNYVKVKLSELKKRLWISEFIRNEGCDLTPDNFQEKFEDYLVLNGHNWIADEDYYDLVKKIAEKLNYVVVDEEIIK